MEIPGGKIDSPVVIKEKKDLPCLLAPLFEFFDVTRYVVSGKALTSCSGRIRDTKRTKSGLLLYICIFLFS